MQTLICFSYLCLSWEEPALPGWWLPPPARGGAEVGVEGDAWLWLSLLSTSWWGVGVGVLCCGGCCLSIFATAQLAFSTTIRRSLTLSLGYFRNSA